MFKAKSAILIFVGLVLVVAARAAFSQTPDCAPRDEIVARLTNIGEQPIGEGISAFDNWFETWVAADTGTWSIVRTFPNGMSCIVVRGVDWIAENDRFEIDT